MTTITRDEIINLARLSALELADSEIASLQMDLSTILAYVEQLNELDTGGVEPAYQVTGLKNRMRSDMSTDHAVDKAALLALAAETHNDQIKVPKVL